MFWRIFYTIVMVMMVPVFLGRTLYRSLKKPAHRDRWHERLGYIKKNITPGGIWIHAVSVGETIATVPIVKRLRQEYPNIPIIFSTVTLTGYERVQQLFGSDVTHLYLPYDVPWMINRFLISIRPRLGIIMEAELWPNLYFGCQRFSIPFIIANARLSERSYKGYCWIKPLMQKTLACVTHVAAQAKADGERFVSLGLDPNRLSCMGNIKFDFPRPSNVEEAGKALRATWGVERPVWIAASTHNSEEEIVLQTFQELKRDFPNLLLILVPRHPERFAAVAMLLEKQGLKFVKRSTQEKANSTTEVFLGDTMGEMALFYAASDLALVGGSFVTVGGHNMLEPAAASIPSISGPHVFNFKEISQWLLEAQAMKLVKEGSELTKTVREWLQDPKARELAGLQGKKVVEQHQGAINKFFAIIYPFLG